MSEFDAWIKIDANTKFLQNKSSAEKIMPLAHLYGITTDDHGNKWLAIRTNMNELKTHWPTHKPFPLAIIYERNDICLLAGFSEIEFNDDKFKNWIQSHTEYWDYPDYLTESSLGNNLLLLFGELFKRDIIIPGSDIKCRADYYSDKLKMIVEFDGPKHFTNAKTIHNDNIKNEVYSKMGLSIIRIPYFIQLSDETISHLFNINTNYEQTYNHGFISDDVILPSDYNELGVKKFISILDDFNFVKFDILESLRNKIKTLKDISLVLPPSLFHIIESNNTIEPQHFIVAGVQLYYSIRLNQTTTPPAAKTSEAEKL
jgi:very-short-patch-repair endonuclease